MKIRCIFILLTFYIGLFPGSLNAQEWYATGSYPKDYNMGGDPTVDHGNGGEGYIFSIVGGIDGFGAYATKIDVGEFRGKAIKLTAYMKTENVSDGASLWCRVDNSNDVGIRFDNMGYRYIQGTTDWTEYQIILDVPIAGSTIYYGFLLSGTGKLWVDGFRTETLNRTWYPQNTGNSYFLYALKAVNDSTVWACGSHDRFLKTTDDGMSWESGPVSGNLSITYYSLAAINKDIAYVAGNLENSDQAVICKTTDGGSHWDLQYMNSSPGVFLNSIAFWDENNGIAVSDPDTNGFLIVTTSDGGQNWTRVPPANVPLPYQGENGGLANLGGSSLAVLNDSIAYFGGGNYDTVRLFRTKDRGNTWAVYNTPLSVNGSVHGISSIAFMDSLIGFAGSVDFITKNKKTLIKTFDGGKSWQPVDSFPPLDISTISFVPGNDSVVYVSSYQGTALSTDQGKTWKMLTTESALGLSFASPENGWLINALDGSINKLQTAYQGNLTDVINEIPEIVQQSSFITGTLNFDQGAIVCCYPNPFNVSTTFQYQIEVPQHVKLEIIDLSGNVVETLVDAFRGKGRYEIEWVPAEQSFGMYLYRLRLRDKTETGKLFFFQ